MEVFRPISRGKVLGRERGGGGYVAQSESISGSELRMAHLFIQKYMNNSLKPEKGYFNFFNKFLLKFLPSLKIKVCLKLSFIKIIIFSLFIKI